MTEHDHTAQRWTCGCDPTLIGIMQAAEVTGNIEVRVAQDCPGCGTPVAMEPYDIGSGPEMSCPHCECCWGVNGQALQPLSLDKFRERLYLLKKKGE